MTLRLPVCQLKAEGNAAFAAKDFDKAMCVRLA